MKGAILAIDAGNSRIKWGLHDGSAWLSSAFLPTGDATALECAASQWPPGVHAVVCNVAGVEAGARIGAALASRQCRVRWFSSTAEACGIRNRYDAPEKLGADRWAALLGASALCPQRPCLVVCAGTATTVDVLDASGEFRGGLILPGFDLMRRALAKNTAQLPLAQGDFAALPRNTDDAIVSGCLHAQLGAIERMFAVLQGDDVTDNATQEALCVLTGGAAPRLAPHLDIPLRLRENLVLEGLVRFASVL